MSRALHYICTIENFKEAIFNLNHLKVLAVYDDGSLVSTALSGYITSTKLNSDRDNSYACTHSGNPDRPITIYCI